MCLHPFYVYLLPVFVQCSLVIGCRWLIRHWLAEFYQVLTKSFTYSSVRRQSLIRGKYKSIINWISPAWSMIVVIGNRALVASGQTFEIAIELWWEQMIRRWYKDHSYYICGCWRNIRILLPNREISKSEFGAISWSLSLDGYGEYQEQNLTRKRYWHLMLYNVGNNLPATIWFIGSWNWRKEASKSPVDCCSCFEKENFLRHLEWKISHVNYFFMSSEQIFS